MSTISGRKDPEQRRLLAIGLGGFLVISIATVLLEPGLVRRFYPLPPDQGAAWYFWQLANPTTLTRVTYWLGYALHQIVVWALLIRSRAAGGEARRKANANLLWVNLAFVALHLVQTWFWYDGLAQDVPIWTSQGSVIVMLVLILFLEIPRRGLAWGKKFEAPRRLYGFVQRWHGLYISWAIVYTFWFHPMDGNWGLMSGFIYMFLLFLQMSMFNRPIHTNPSWVVLMEAGVIVHATLITVYKDNPIWPMFMVGFLVMFVVTQMHAIPVLRKWRWPITILSIAATVAIYVFVRGISHAYEITFIPVALYGGAVGLWLLGLLIERIAPSRTERTAGTA
jgi:hypothetical protein